MLPVIFKLFVGGLLALLLYNIDHSRVTENYSKSQPCCTEVYAACLTIAAEREREHLLKKNVLQGFIKL